MGPSEILKKGT